jgi:hypothetical protein
MASTIHSKDHSKNHKCYFQAFAPVYWRGVGGLLAFSSAGTHLSNACGIAQALLERPNRSGIRKINEISTELLPFIVLEAE